MNPSDILSALMGKYGGKQNFMQQVQNFANSLNGANPQQIIQQKLDDGSITTEQFERARMLANMITGENK